MNLEKKINEGGNAKQTTIDLGISTLATIGAYNLAGAVSDAAHLHDPENVWTTVGIMSACSILGYKTRSIFNRIKKGKNKRAARQKVIAEISGDPEFLERQGIKKERLGIGKTLAKYALTVPAGGALGYYAGIIGIAPLCVYFGNNYGWNEHASLESGQITGPLVSAYAFTEMLAKKQYKRITTTASALAGVAGGYFIGEKLNLSVLDGELWPALGICAATGLVAGTIGNLMHKEAQYGLEVSKLPEYKSEKTKNNSKKE